MPEYAVVRKRLRHMGVPLPHVEEEFQWLWEKLAGLDVRSLVEIGSRDGGSFYMLGRLLPVNGIAVSVDLPGAAWGYAGTEQNLQEVSYELRKGGILAHVLFGDSHKAETARAALHRVGKPDLVFIDGDHTYEGVKLDWEMYGRFARVVAFHDVDQTVDQRGAVYGVGKLFNELVQQGVFSHYDKCSKGLGTAYGILKES